MHAVMCVLGCVGFLKQENVEHVGREVCVFVGVCAYFWRLCG